MEYLHNNKEQFADAINLTVYQTGIAPDAIEKDYYVTMILRKLAQNFPFIVFKGGTSLSKCHRVIKRFSEDIDITIDISLTQGQKKKVKEALVEICSEMGLIIPNIEDTRSRRDYNRYILEYSSVLPSTGNNVVPTVLVETSYKTISFPTVVLPVHNYIGDLLKTEAPELIELYNLSPFEMKVQDINRTLADKIFAICDYYLQDNVQKHSRHIYDIYKLLPLVPMDDNFKTLFEEVRIGRKPSPVCLSAQDHIDLISLLNEIVEKDIYKSDYQTLTDYLLEEDVPYQTAVSALHSIINSPLFE